MLNTLRRWLTPRLYASEAHAAAQSRFVTDTTVVNGSRYIAMFDPVLDLKVAVEADREQILPVLFRDAWMTRYIERADR